MQIFVEVKETDLDIFRTFAGTIGIDYIEIDPGFYLIDNVLHSITPVAELDVPKGCLLQWDYDYITKMYNNEVIGRFNQGKLQWTLLHPKSMEPMVQVLMYGTGKYERDNWQKACPKKFDLLDSLERHSKALISGESIDKESNLPHIGHLMCNAMFYSYWEQKTNGLFEKFEESSK